MGDADVSPPDGAVSISDGLGRGAGDSGNSDAGPACGTQLGLRPGISVRTTGPGLAGLDRPYEGDAVVVRSTVDELILYFVPGGVRAGAVGMHVTISGWTPMPVLSVGALVWLSKTPAGNQQRDVLMYGIDPWGISVRNRAGGTLLFGASRNSPDVASTPVIATNKTPFCKVASSSSCAPGQVTYYSVDVQGDAPVTIRHGESATVQIGGVAYEVGVTTKEEPAQTAPGLCADYHSDSAITLDVRAKDMASIASSLARGDLPACVEGNERIPAVSLSTASFRDAEGTVSFSGMDSLYVGAYDFDLVGQSEQVRLSAPAELFPKPSMGQKFWLSIPGSDVAALRTTQNGELVFGHFQSNLPLPSDTSARIAQELGVTLSAEPGCTYTVDDLRADVPIWDAVFATNPPVRVRSGSAGVVSIGGRTYRALVRGIGGYLTVTVVAIP